MSELAYIGRGETLPIHTSVSTLPEPTAYDGGVSLDSLKTGRTNPETSENVRGLPNSAILYIDAVSGDVTMTGPVELLAGNDADQKYRLAAQLAGGETFLVKAQKGYSGRVFFGGDWDRVRLVSPGLDGAVNVKLVAEVQRP